MKDNRIKRKLYETHTIRYNEYRQINAYIRQWIDNGKGFKRKDKYQNTTVINAYDHYIIEYP